MSYWKRPERAVFGFLQPVSRMPVYATADDIETTGCIDCFCSNGRAGLFGTLNGIRIAEAERGQDLPLLRFHHLGFGIVFVV